MKDFVIDMVSFKENDQIGPYRVVRPLGKGGMGAVYEVVHMKLGVHYALKTFVLENGYTELFCKRFQAEGRLLARLRHPRLVRVFDLDVEPSTGVLYYVMDLVVYKDGEAYSLADLEQGGADEEHLVQWFRELCDALAYVHSNGIVHRDIKPANILIAPERHVVLSDFGISKVHDEQLRTDVEVTKTIVVGGSGGRIVMGTVGYMAPEVIKGKEATPVSDVYSLGVVFFKLLTGVMYEPCLSTGDRNAFKLLDHFEHNWKDILPAMLEEDPANRPVDLKALAESLASYADVSCPAPIEAAKRRRLQGWALWVACASFLLAVGVAVWMILLSETAGNAVLSERDPLEDAFSIPESVK